MNDHFISRVHTSPWATSDGWLHYFNYRDGTFGRERVKKLFARDRLNEPDVESRLDALMESKIGNLRDRTRDGRYLLKSWKEYRALALLLLLQGPRTSAALQSPDHGRRLAMLLRMSDAQIDAMVQLWLKGQNLVWHRLPPGEPLFFPSTGVFALPVFDDAVPGGVDFAFATPLDTRTFIAAVSKTADYETFARAAKNGFYYPALSVGLNSDLILIPPHLIGRDGAETLRSWRDGTRENVQLFTAARELSCIALVGHGARLNVRERFVQLAGLK